MNYFNLIMIAMVVAMSLPSNHAVAGSPVQVTGVASVETNNNIGFAEHQNDQQADQITTAGIAVTQNWLLANRQGVQIRSSVEHQRFQQFSDLNRSQVAVKARYVWQPGSAYDSPWFGISA